MTENSRPSDRETLLAMSAYLVFVLPLFFAPQSKYKPYHVNQGLLLFLATLFTNALWLIPRVGWLLMLFGWPVLTMMTLRGIIVAARGQMKPLPWIGHLLLIK